MTPQTPRRQTVVLILSLVLSMLAVGLSIQALDRGLPAWVEIEEGPVAHGIDKFYRKAVFMGDVDVQGGLNFGANSLYPIGYGVTDYAVELGTSTVTTTLALTLSSITTPTIGLCTLGEDPDATEALCSISLVTQTATLKLWNAGATGAGTTGTAVHWMVIGQE